MIIIYIIVRSYSKVKLVKQMKRPRINLSNSHREILYKEFPVSKATINNALSYRYDSEISKSIRKRAKELLKDEVKKVESYED